MGRHFRLKHQFLKIIIGVSVFIFASLFYLYALNLNLFMISNFNLKYTTSLIFIKYSYDMFFSSLGYNRFYLPLVCLITICYFYKYKKRSQQYK